MSSDLADRYNEGIVPPPDLPEDVPPLRQPGSQTTQDQGGINTILLIGAILVVVVILAVCVTATGTIILFALGGR